VPVRAAGQLWRAAAAGNENLAAHRAGAEPMAATRAWNPGVKQSRIPRFCHGRQVSRSRMIRRSAATCSRSCAERGTAADGESGRERTGKAAWEGARQLSRLGLRLPDPGGPSEGRSGRSPYASQVDGGSPQVAFWASAPGARRISLDDLGAGLLKPAANWACPRSTWLAARQAVASSAVPDIRVRSITSRIRLPRNLLCRITSAARQDAGADAHSAHASCRCRKFPLSRSSSWAEIIEVDRPRARTLGWPALRRSARK